MKTYEAMFVLDAGLATDWPAAEGEIKRILDRAGAEIIGTRSWEERKLAYEMGSHKRGLYVLVYFKCEPTKIDGIERDVQLGEKTIRVLILRRDKFTAEQIAKSLAAGPPPKTLSRGPEEWGERSGGDRWGGGDRGGDRGGPRRERRPEGEGATAVADVPEAAGEDAGA